MNKSTALALLFAILAGISVCYGNRIDAFFSLILCVLVLIDGSIRDLVDRLDTKP